MSDEGGARRAAGGEGLDEPRARDVVFATDAPLLDFSRRWEEMESVAPSLPTFVKPEMRSTIDPGDWRTGFLAVNDREIPQGLRDALRQCTPQASLRDLFRPVRSFYATLAPIEGTQAINLFSQLLEEVRSAQMLDPIPQIAPTVKSVREEQLRRRAFIAETWQPIRSDDEERTKVLLYPEEPED